MVNAPNVLLPPFNVPAGFWYLTSDLKYSTFIFTKGIYINQQLQRSLYHCTSHQQYDTIGPALEKCLGEIIGRIKDRCAHRRSSGLIWTRH